MSLIKKSKGPDSYNKVKQFPDPVPSLRDNHCEQVPVTIFFSKFYFKILLKIESCSKFIFLNNPLFIHWFKGYHVMP
jgi:hypothetical protein